jgi:hypothetical protein
LAALAPDAGESEATEIGRRFGRWYRAEIEDRPPRRLSVADALRTHGDRFRERIAATKKVGTSQPAMPGEAELESQWLAYVERVEAKFRSEQPEPHSLFLARRAERREQMQASRIFRNRPEMLAQALAYHDSDEGRLRGFAKDCGRIVLPFDQWRVRRTHNQQAS